MELPPMYYAIWGHDVYTNAYDQEIERFLENLKMESVYYCVDIHGIRFIVLGSDSKVPEGELGKEQLNWLRERLETCFHFPSPTSKGDGFRHVIFIGSRNPGLVWPIEFRR